MENKKFLFERKIIKSCSLGLPLYSQVLLEGDDTSFNPEIKKGTIILILIGFVLNFTFSQIKIN